MRTFKKCCHLAEYGYPRQGNNVITSHVCGCALFRSLEIKPKGSALAFAGSIFCVFRSFIHWLKFVLRWTGPVMGVLRRNPFGGKQHACKRQRYRDYVHFVFPRTFY